MEVGEQGINNKIKAREEIIYSDVLFYQLDCTMKILEGNKD